MYKKRIKQIICLFLALLQFGCRTAYKLNLYTQPSGATVQVGSKFYGQTPCKIEIPIDSVLIVDNHIDITYSLPDGRTVTKSYDLRKYQPPSQLPCFVAGVFMVPGVLMIGLTHTKEDDKYTSFDEEDESDFTRDVRWTGVGLIAVGVLVYYILGGDSQGAEGYDILENFEDVSLN